MYPYGAWTAQARPRGEQWETAAAIRPQFENGRNTEIGEVNSVRQTLGAYATRLVFRVHVED